MTRDASVLRMSLWQRWANHGWSFDWRRPVAAAAVVLAAVAVPVLTSGQPTITEAAVVVLVCFGFTFVGLRESTRVPDSAIGPLLCLFGISALLSTFVARGTPPLAFTLGYAVHAVPPLALAHLLLCYPSGKLGSAFERRAIRTAYLVVAPMPLLQLLVYDPASHDYGLFDCHVATQECRKSLLVVADAPTAYDVLSGVQYIVQIVAAVGLTYLVTRRVLRSPPRTRWIFVGLLAVALLVAARVIVGNGVYVAHRSREFEQALFWTAGLAQAGVAAVLLHGMLRRRLAHASVSRLLVDLEGTQPAAVEHALAEAVHDPTLRVAFWLPERGRYVDAAGMPLDPPRRPSGPGVTPLERDGERLAVILHDPSLDEEPGLVEAAGAAAGLVLHNMRLQAELRARLLELEQSRKRIVQAADAERRRLERDIHDGAQQRLVALAVSLRVAEQGLDGERASHVERVLDSAVAELQLAVRELRELARGVYPAILTEEGLGAALESLVSRSPIPVQLGTVPAERAPADIEVAAYFVVSEALANAAKHSGASRVRVNVLESAPGLVVAVEDDGRGGADPQDGSGLSGLADRVGAHGGRLQVESRPGRGTSIVAEFPCAR